MQSEGQWSAVQGAAMMILLRLFPFFCCGRAFSAAYAKQMLLTAILHTALILPLLPHRLQDIFARVGFRRLSQGNFRVSEVRMQK